MASMAKFYLFGNELIISAASERGNTRDFVGATLLDGKLVSLGSSSAREREREVHRRRATKEALSTNRTTANIGESQ
jgi:hypothetical protein